MINKLIKKLYLIVLDIIFPKRCVNCATLNTFWCTRCQIPPLGTALQRCIICQKLSLNGFTHPKCQNSLTPDRLISLYPYKNYSVKKLVVLAKYSGVPECLTTAVDSASFFLTQNLIDKNFMISYIPAHKTKQKIRGFNQSEVIANKLADILQTSAVEILTKPKNTKEQKLLNKIHRQKNLQHAFEIKPKVQMPTNIILVDDVITTGSTFLEAAKILKQGGVSHITCLAIAQD